MFATLQKISFFAGHSKLLAYFASFFQGRQFNLRVVGPRIAARTFSENLLLFKKV